MKFRAIENYLRVLDSSTSLSDDSVAVLVWSVFQDAARLSSGIDGSDVDPTIFAPACRAAAVGILDLYNKHQDEIINHFNGIPSLMEAFEQEAEAAISCLQDVEERISNLELERQKRGKELERLKNAEAELAELERIGGDLQNQIDLLSSKDLETSISAQQRHNLALEEQLTVLLQQQEEALGQRSLLEGQVSDLEPVLSDLLQSNTSLGSREAKLKDEVKAATDEKTRLEKALDAMEKERDGLRQWVEGFDDRSKDLRQSHASYMDIWTIYSNLWDGVKAQAFTEEVLIRSGQLDAAVEFSGYKDAEQWFDSHDQAIRQMLDVFGEQIRRAIEFSEGVLKKEAKGNE